MAPRARVRGSGGKGRSSGFGSVETLPSGRYRVRWRDGEGRRQSAEQTFATASAARAFLATVKADMLRRTYRAPRRASDHLADYGSAWIDGRPGLKASTRHQYEIDFRRHIEPQLGDRRLDGLEPGDIRRWHTALTGALRKEFAGTSRDVGRTHRMADRGAGRARPAALAPDRRDRQRSLPRR